MAEIHGFVFDVVEERSGDELLTAASSGAISLVVVNAVDFSAGGSVLLPNGQVVEVDSVTFADLDVDRSGTLKITPATTASFAVGDRVDVWSVSAEEVVSTWAASVRDSTTGAVTQHPISHALLDALPDGAAGVQGASVVVTQDESGRRSVTEVLGKKKVIQETDFLTSSSGQRVVIRKDGGTDGIVELFSDTSETETATIIDPSSGIDAGGYSNRPGVKIETGLEPDAVGYPVGYPADFKMYSGSPSVAQITTRTSGNGAALVALRGAYAELSVNDGFSLTAGVSVTPAGVVLDGPTTTADDVEITSATKGVILRSPNGTRWRVTIDNAGNLVRTAL